MKERIPNPGSNQKSKKVIRQICYMLCSDPLHRYELLYSWIRVGADPQDELLHHHLLPPVRTICSGQLDQVRTADRSASTCGPSTCKL